MRTMVQLTANHFFVATPSALSIGNPNKHILDASAFSAASRDWGGGLCTARLKTIGSARNCMPWAALVTDTCSER